MSEIEQELEQGCIATLDHEGDTKYTWDRKNKVECQAAKEHFENLRKKGFLVFKVILGFKTAPTTEFNPEAGAYLYEPPTEVSEVATAAQKEVVAEDLSPTLTETFDPEANYVATPPMKGG